MKIDKILNPVDGSEHAIHACHYAIELAKVFNARIILLHCHRSFPIELREDHFQEAINTIRDDSEKLVKPYNQMLEENRVDYEIRLLDGRAGDVIPEVARIEKIDVIVMGSRGVTDLEGLILGSVAHRVLHKSNCPVFITK